MYNRIILVGRLVADPELRQTPNGTNVTSFAIAVDRAFSSRDGERQTDFIDVVAWRQTAEFICRYFNKGKVILVEGSLQTRTYTDKNDQKRKAWEVVADNARFVGSKSESEGSGGRSFAPAPQETAAPAPAYSAGSVEDFAEIDDDDGDLPF